MGSPDIQTTNEEEPLKFPVVKGTNADEMPLEAHETLGVSSELDQLIELRDQLGFSESGIWTEERLHVANEGEKTYKAIYSQASEKLKRYLRSPIVMQAFTGVRPVLSLATEYGKNYKYARQGELRSKAWDEEQLFVEVQEELQQLLTNFDPLITIRKVDYTKIKHKGDSSIELMNERALRVIALENPDLLNLTESNLSVWLQNHPEEWPGVAQGESISLNRELRYGVLSGFPRSACELFSENSTSPLNYIKIIKWVLTGAKSEPQFHTIYHPTLQGDAVTKAAEEAGLYYIHFNKEHLSWTQEAAALLNQCIKIYNLETPIY